MRLLKALLMLANIIFRIFLIYKVFYGLYLNSQNSELHPLSEITWYIYFMIGDFYVMNIFNHEKDEE